MSMDSTAVVQWFSKQLQPKKIKVEALKDLKSGTLFLQLMHFYFPKSVNLTKVYIKPKSSFQVSQNYRQLLQTFIQLGWRKIDPQKYVKQQDKDCLDIANLIIRKIRAFKNSKSEKADLANDTLKSFDTVLDNTIIEQAQSLQSKAIELQNKKQKLLNKLMSIESILNNTSQSKIAKNLIMQIIEQE